MASFEIRVVGYDFVYLHPDSNSGVALMIARILAVGVLALFSFTPASAATIRKAKRACLIARQS
jgi:hypothetical protein